MKNNHAGRPQIGTSSVRKAFAARLLISILVSLVVGCASQWSVRTEHPTEVLRWPNPPEAPKVTFLMSLKGFEQEASAKSILKSMVYGKDNANNSFSLPVSVSVGADGRIAVADTGLNCVHLYIPGEKQYVRLSGAGEKEFLSPVGVAFDDDLRLYVSDSRIGHVFVFGKDGHFISTFGKVASDRMKRPTGLAFGRDNKLLYVVDTLGNRVDAFDKDGRNVFSFGARGEETASFNYPTHISWASDRRLYIADAMNFRIEIFDESGRFLREFGRHGDAPGQIAMPKGVAVDRDGDIYVVDALFDNVQIFDREGKFLFPVGSRGTGPGAFWLPSGIFMGDDDKLYVCDTYNHRVQVFRTTISEKIGR